MQEQHVLGLEIAVHDVARVQEAQRSQDLSQEMTQACVVWLKRAARLARHRLINYE